MTAHANTRAKHVHSVGRSEKSQLRFRGDERRGGAFVHFEGRQDDNLLIID